MLGKFESLYDLFEAFPDEQSCVDHLRAIRWRDGEFCLSRSDSCCTFQ